MKTKFIFINLIILLILVSCSSPMKYANTMFNNDYFQNKTIYFKLSEESKKVKIVKKGPNQGETKIPNNEETFKKSIIDLAGKTQLNLKYTENEIELTNNEVLVIVNITEINWIFTISSATMKSSITYQLNDQKDKTFDIIGSHKNNSGGSKEWNLYNSLENANYLFLKELEKTK